MKKILYFLFLVILVINLVGCGTKNKNIDDESNDKLAIKDLKIKDFDWKVKKGKCNGDDCYVFSLINNSKYDLIGVAISYKVKDDVTSEELEVYKTFMKNAGIDEADVYDIVLINSSSKMIEKGNSIDNLELYIGFKSKGSYYMPSTKQFDLMTPKELGFYIIYNNKAYLAFYDFTSKTWLFDSETYDADVWPETDFAKQFEPPKFKHYIIEESDDDELELRAYGVTKEEFKEYKEQIKEKYNISAFEYSDYYSGEDSSGNHIRLDYESDYLKIKFYNWNF